MNHRLLTLILLATTVPAGATLIRFDGETEPQIGAYGTLFTTIGGGSHSAFFPGTDWSSDGNILTMTTIYPNYGLWFGRTDNTGGDPAGFSMGSGAAGNRVEARVALGLSSTEWSLYFYDTSGSGASFYFLNNGYEITYNGSTTFIAAADMTSFHTYTAHVQNGLVAYFRDNVPIATGAAITGSSNFLLIGDGSGSTPSGTGSFHIDYLSIDTAAPFIPEPSTWTLGSGLLAGMAFLIRRRRR